MTQGIHWPPEKVHRLGVLMDAYEALLPPRQHEVMRLKLDEDLSLREIAESIGISRQACEDALKRCERALGSYERKLGLVERLDAYREKVEEALELIEDMEQDNWNEMKEQAMRLLGNAVGGGEPENGI